MLRLMLDHHPAIACMQESDFMVTHYDALGQGPPEQYAAALESDWLWRRSGLSFPNGARSYREVVHGFFAQRREATGKDTVGATVLHEFHPLPALFPTARYVHLLRDGRPVAASIRNMGWAGNLYVGAQRWRQAVEQVLVLQARVPAERWLEVRYEKLVADPAGQLARIARFLGHDFTDAMLFYSADTTYEAPDAANADRWRSALCERDVRHAELAAGDLLERLGHDRCFPPVTAGALQRAALRVHHRYHRTRFRFARYGAGLMIARWLWRLIGVRRPKLEARFEAIGERYVR
jgi:hypothetical protein